MTPLCRQEPTAQATVMLFHCDSSGAWVSIYLLGSQSPCLIS